MMTTRALRGIPKSDKITVLWSSGTYFDRSVLMAGKYIPTQASYAISAPIMPASEVVFAAVKNAARPIEMVDAPIIFVAVVSASLFLDLIDLLKRIDPRKLPAMKQLKMMPKGVTAPSPKKAETAGLTASGH
mmetsp:Transcript_23327/g.34779  ORF Transcript_23327/g.34779 Transcript_23327/m.34779 type:complete len:132 (-) Transcript_23327:1248-1643(-)